jgi:hypothetical protein
MSQILYYDFRFYFIKIRSFNRIATLLQKKVHRILGDLGLFIKKRNERLYSTLRYLLNGK